MRTVKITMRSIATGIVRTKEFEMTGTQFAMYLDSKNTIQTIFPNYTAEQREFLTTGKVTKAWNEAYPSIREDIDEADLEGLSYYKEKN